MHRFLTVAIVVIMLVLSFSTVADAGPFRRRAERLQRDHVYRVDHDAHDLSRRGYLHWSEIYPRYYGQFHARFLQHYGYPTGDIGLRGFPW